MDRRRLGTARWPSHQCWIASEVLTFSRGKRRSMARVETVIAEPGSVSATKQLVAGAWTGRRSSNAKLFRLS
jgi:hypothetical protein